MRANENIQIHKNTILFTGLASSSFRNVDQSESASSVRSASISSQNKQSEAKTKEKNKGGPKAQALVGEDCMLEFEFSILLESLQGCWYPSQQL